MKSQKAALISVSFNKKSILIRVNLSKFSISERESNETVRRVLKFLAKPRFSEFITLNTAA